MKNTATRAATRAAPLAATLASVLGLLTACSEIAAHQAVDKNTPGPWNGTYAGAAFNQDPAIPEQICPQRIPIEGFQVAGRYAVFGVYSGEIDPNGNVSLQYQNTFIWGQLADGQFNGQFRQNLRCIYTVQLSRQ
jgi:hypothetical protein